MAKKLELCCPMCKSSVKAERGFLGWKKTRCPMCYADISVDKSSQFFSCPICEISFLDGDSRTKDGRCPNCGEVLVQDDSAKACTTEEGERPCRIQCADPHYGIWKPFKTFFPYESQLVVDEGLWCVCFSKGQYMGSVGPGVYRLADLVPEKGIAVPGGTVHADIYFVPTYIPHTFKWMDKLLVIPNDSNGIYVVAGGSVELAVTNPEKFLDLVGHFKQPFESLLDAEFLAINPRAGKVGSKIWDLALGALHDALKEVLEEKSYKGDELERFRGEIEEAYRRLLDEKLAAYGVKIDSSCIREIRSRQRSAEEREREESDRRRQVRERIEGYLFWYQIPVSGRIRYKGEASSSSECTLEGICSLKVQDYDKLLKHPDLQRWMEIRHHSGQQVLQSKITSHLHAAVDAYFKLEPSSCANGDEFSYFRAIRRYMHDCLQTALSDCGLAVQHLSLQQEEAAIQEERITIRNLLRQPAEEIDR